MDLGADVEGLVVTARLFDEAAHRVGRCRREAAGAVDSLWWQGRGADRYRSQVRGRLMPAVSKAEGWLADVALEVRRQARQQELASAADGASGVADPIEGPGARAPRIGPQFGRDLPDPDRTQTPALRVRSGSFTLDVPTGWEHSEKRDVADRPLFGPGGPRPIDVTQGAVGDCYLDSSLAGLANSPQGRQRLRQLVTAHDDGTYTVRFADGRRVGVDGDLYVTDGDDATYSEITKGSIWVGVVEKAYAQRHGGYQPIDGGRANEALTELVGGEGESRDLDHISKDGTWQILKAAEHDGRPLTASSSDDTGVGYVKDGGKVDPVGNHSWTVVGTHVGEGQRWVTLRNPWGQNDGLNFGDHGVMAPARPGEDGYVDIPLDLFVKRFIDLDGLSSW